MGQGLLLLSGGILDIQTFESTLPNPFEIRGGVIHGVVGTSDPDAALTFSGPGTITEAANLVVDGGTFAEPSIFVRMDFTGSLSGRGGLTIRGGSSTRVFLSGTAANTYTGTTTVNGGNLVLKKPAGVNAIAGPLVIGDGDGRRQSRRGQPGRR